MNQTTTKQPGYYPFDRDDKYTFNWWLLLVPRLVVGLVAILLTIFLFLATVVVTLVTIWAVFAIVFGGAG